MSNKEKPKSKSKEKEKEKEPKETSSHKEKKTKKEDLTPKIKISEEKEDIKSALFPPSSHLEKSCIHHGQQLIFFCESCEEPICQQCGLIGPHNSQLHRKTPIIDIYKSRALKLSHSINTGLLPKKDQLLAQIHRIEYRIEEIKYVKSIIERDIRAEFSSMLEKLNRAEGMKTTLLQHEVNEIQKDLEKINEIGEDFMELTSERADPINFLLNSRKYYENIEFLITKPLKSTIDVYPYDLPRELTELKKELEMVESYKMALKFKDEVIFKLLLERKANEEKIKLQADQEISEEVSEWAKLTDKYANELKNYHLICYFCGNSLDHISVNKKCKVNLQELKPDFVGFTDKIPNEKFLKNGKHFFSHPKSSSIIDKEISIKDIRPKKEIFKVNEQIYDPFTKLRKIILEKGIDLVRVFEDHDKNHSGNINHIQFSYILTEIVGISAEDLEKIIKEIDPTHLNIIKYYDFLNLVYSNSKKKDHKF